jgi:hypothetical protein
MRLEDERESENIEDRRGSPVRLGGGRRSIGLGGILIALAAIYFGADPALVLSLLEGGAPIEQRQPAPRPGHSGAEQGQTRVFVSKVLASTEDVWQSLFSRAGQAYREPTLVLFSGATNSACGLGQAAMGPFYCPPDQKVFLDLRFFDELQRDFGAPGDFAQAYVIAHEVGHHVQNLLGIASKVHGLQQRSRPEQANRLSVALELQADCLAGVWANHAQKMRNILEPGDIEEGLRAASAVGDDTLQRRGQGYVVPESFTHGSAEQRASWFQRGFKAGAVQACNTFEG